MHVRLPYVDNNICVSIFDLKSIFTQKHLLHPKKNQAATIRISELNKDLILISLHLAWT